MNAHEQFRALSSGFYGAPLAVRQEVAGDIAQVAISLELDEVLEFARSPDPGERVGAAIALGVKMRTSVRTREDPGVEAALRALLGDTRSRVRYRAVEALRKCPEAAPRFKDDLSAMAATETNADVRSTVVRMLRRTGA